jgi:hypothetical protein
MNDPEQSVRNNSVTRAVRSELFIFAARAAMLFASFVVLPSLGFGLSRLIAAADRQTAKIDLAIQRQELMEQNIKLGVTARIESAERILTDHELRLRLVERPPRPLQP